MMQTKEWTESEAKNRPLNKKEICIGKKRKKKQKKEMNSVIVILVWCKSIGSVTIQFNV